MNVENAIKSRRSVRKFRDKKPNWRDVIECIDAVRFAPSAGKNFTLKTILVNDKNKIQKIANAAEQPFIAEAKYVVVIYSDPTRLISLFENRGKVYSRQQAGAAIENFLLSIEDKGLSTCWVGHFDDSMIKRELKIPEKMEIEAVFPVGYESGKTPKRNKINLDGILFFNTHGTKKMTSPKSPE
jgi:nitroreductase